MSCTRESTSGLEYSLAPQFKVVTLGMRSLEIVATFSLWRSSNLLRIKQNDGKIFSQVQRGRWILVRVVRDPAHQHGPPNCHVCGHLQ